MTSWSRVSTHDDIPYRPNNFDVNFNQHGIPSASPWICILEFDVSNYWLAWIEFLALIRKLLLLSSTPKWESYYRCFRAPFTFRFHHLVMVSYLWRVQHLDHYCLSGIMPLDNLSMALKPLASHDNSSPAGASAPSHLPTPACESSDKSKSYLLAVNSFKDGQDFSAKPSAYEKRRATEAVDDDGQIGPAMTVKSTTPKNWQ